MATSQRGNIINKKQLALSMLRAKDEPNLRAAMAELISESSPTSLALSTELTVGTTLSVGSTAAITGLATLTAGYTIGGVEVMTALTTLTATEIVGTSAGDLGHASGATLVAAPGAGYALIFLNAIAIYDYATAAYTGGGDDTSIRLGGGGAAITGIVTSANLLGAAGDKIVRFDPLTSAALPVTANVAISMVSTTAWTQPGTAAGVLRVYTTYAKVATGL